MPEMPIMSPDINKSFCPFASAVALVQKCDKPSALNGYPRGICQSTLKYLILMSCP